MSDDYVLPDAPGSDDDMPEFKVGDASDEFGQAARTARTHDRQRKRVEQFAPVPTRLYRERNAGLISQREYLILVHLNVHQAANHFTQPGSVTVQIRELLDVLGLPEKSRDSIANDLKNLRDRGYIEFDPPGRGKTAAYRIELRLAACQGSDMPR